MSNRDQQSFIRFVSLVGAGVGTAALVAATGGVGLIVGAVAFGVGGKIGSMLKEREDLR